jgi:SAM-dependent methyltransferase
VPSLLGNDALERSSVVANRTMNRERDLTGSNGYTRELGIDIPALISARLANGGFRWLDICCGTGKALRQCSSLFDDERLRITGIDLVDFYAAPPTNAVRLVTASVTTWTPEDPGFDLITCVHGLHYLGDKLGVLAKAATWLTPGGQLVANLDLNNLRTADDRPLGRRATTALRAAGFTVDTRRHRIGFAHGDGPNSLPFTYLGANSEAGPNYTGQPAVHSHYT